MINLSTRFFGLDLKSPIIIASSGLSSSVAKIKLLEENGAAAVVLKSIFEEEIYNEFNSEVEKQAIDHHNLEYLDYFDYKIREKVIKQYLKLITEAKAEVSIPIVASINCTSGNDWAFFAVKLAEAGADALELNLFVLPSDFDRTEAEIREYYFATIEKVLSKVNIPVTLKLSPYFSDLGRMVKQLSNTGIAGITLFNRFYNIDIDLATKKVVPAMILSHPFEYLQTLRWMGILSGKVGCDLAASTGIHSPETAIKMMMSGANAVQVCSAVYKNGFTVIKEMHDGIAQWMEANNYSSLKDFIGQANAFNIDSPAIYERVQFMKYFSEYDQKLI